MKKYENYKCISIYKRKETETRICDSVEKTQTDPSRQILETPNCDPVKAAQIFDTL